MVTTTLMVKKRRKGRLFKNEIKRKYLSSLKARAFSKTPKTSISPST
jgi:hypothetical protein